MHNDIRPEPSEPPPHFVDFGDVGIGARQWQDSVPGREDFHQPSAKQTRGPGNRDPHHFSLLLESSPGSIPEAKPTLTSRPGSNFLTNL
jgi:hypothetical protein